MNYGNEVPIFLVLEEDQAYLAKNATELKINIDTLSPGHGAKMQLQTPCLTWQVCPEDMSSM